MRHWVGEQVGRESVTVAGRAVPGRLRSFVRNALLVRACGVGDAARVLDAADGLGAAA